MRSGTDLSEKFREKSQRVWEIKLAKLPRGKLTVSIADKQGT